MEKYFLFTKSFFFTFMIFLASVREYYAYTPPAAKVEVLRPVGFRISVPDEHGITLVAFHVKFNEDFNGLEAGQIAMDVNKVRNGRWVYEDRRTMVKRDDIVYYWVHVVYNGLGYNLLDQSYRVVEFYNYDGTPYVDVGIEEQDCTTKSATWIFDKNGGQRRPCPRQLLFNDNFNNFNSTKWNLIKRFAHISPDYEFIVYITSEVMDVSDRLRIKPILLDAKFGDDFALIGKLILDNCTDQIDTNLCQRQAVGSNILPPVISGRIDTKRKFEFLYGRIEVRAKLPRGDWMYPVIALQNAENPEEHGMYREIRIASSVGNEELITSSNDDVGGRILHAGALVTSINRNGSSNSNRLNLPKRPSSKLWSNDYHVYEIEWKSDRIITKVDGVQYGEQTVDGAFSKRSFLTLGVAVGGVHEFEDLSTSSGYVKPWRNIEAQAMYNFYKNKNLWYSSWGTTNGLQVDYVKVWAL